MSAVTISADRPLCHYCHQRVAVTPVDINGADDPDRTLLQLVKRRFLEHFDFAGDVCAGSGQTLAVARGRQEDDA